MKLNAQCALNTAATIAKSLTVGEAWVAKF